MPGKYLIKPSFASLLISLLVFLWVALHVKREDGVSRIKRGTSIFDSSMSEISYVDWSKVKPRKKVNKEEHHDKWIVVTSIPRPTEQVKKLAVVEGWKLLVVGDSKTPKDWR